MQNTLPNLRGLTGGWAVGRIGGLMGGLTVGLTAETIIRRYDECICWGYFQDWVKSSNKILFISKLQPYEYERKNNKTTTEQ